MPKYRNIVFLQGEDANAPLDLLDIDNNSTLDYLLQWDFGEGTEYEVPPWGFHDHVLSMQEGKYVISWSTNLNYISLTEVL